MLNDVPRHAVQVSDGNVQTKSDADERAFTAVSLQLPASAESPVARRESVVSLLTGVEDADLIVLPELWVTGYNNFGAYRHEAEPLDGPTLECLRSIATQKSAYVVGGTFLERAGSALHNTAVVLDPRGEVVHTYRKTHLMSYQSSERTLVEPGQSAGVVDTPLGCLGVAVCYDVRFPELFRAMVDQGAEFFIIPAAWPAARIELWQLFLQARAAENQAFVLGCNSAGDDYGTDLGGRSLVVDPSGRVTSRGGVEPGVVRTCIELAKVRDVRDQFPALKHRRAWTTDVEGAAAQGIHSGRSPAVR